MNPKNGPMYVLERQTETVRESDRQTCRLLQEIYGMMGVYGGGSGKQLYVQQQNLG